MAGVAAAFLADNPQATPAEVKAAIVQVQRGSAPLRMDVTCHILTRGDAREHSQLQDNHGWAQARNLLAVPLRAVHACSSFLLTSGAAA